MKKLLHKESLVVFKAHLKGFLFRVGSLEPGGSPAFVWMARREVREGGPGKCSTRRQTQQKKVKQLGKCT